MTRLAQILSAEAVELGYLGPSEGSRVVSRHVLESAALLPHLPAGDPVVDVGSGAGLPGLVLGALGREVLLIDAQRRRSDFLTSVLKRLGIQGAVRHTRAEDAGRSDLRDRSPVVVARALAAPAVALELCLPLVAVGGVFALLATPESLEDPAVRPGGIDVEASKSGPERIGMQAAASALAPRDIGSRRAEAPAQQDETRAASVGDGPGTSMTSRDVAEADTSEGDAKGLVARPGGDVLMSPGASEEDGDWRPSNNTDVVSGLLGGGEAEWVRLAVPGASAPRWVMIVHKVRPTPDRFPRRPGVPKRRPQRGDVTNID